MRKLIIEVEHYCTDDENKTLMVHAVVLDDQGKVLEDVSDPASTNLLDRLANYWRDESRT
jgi:hypothetical protein